MPERLDPMSDYVLVEVEPPKPYNEVAGFTHVVVPAVFSHGPVERAVVGTVLKKGPACQDSAVVFGSHVVIPKWRGAYLNPEKSLMMVRESEILAVHE